MLLISELRQYCEQVKAAIEEIKRLEIAVTEEELSKYLQDHTKEQNTFLLALVPEYDLTGSHDNSRWENTLGFFFLEKTDYSMHDRAGYLSIYERTQLVAKKFVEKLIKDKSDNTGLFCGFLAWLTEESISVSPIKGLNGCNGWLVQVSMLSRF